MSPGPLDGVLVVDLTRYLPGPFAARMLSEQGARVIKVEEPELGDPLRSAPPVRKGRSRLAELLLRGVESVALDLARADAVDVLRRLLAVTDVMLESFRPGALERFGIEPSRLCRQNPGLIVCSISGWGQSGPRAGRAGHDLTYQAVAGALASTGSVPALQSADLLGAWSSVAAVASALFRRERSGKGAWIDSSIFDAAIVGNVIEWASAGSGKEVGEPGGLTGLYPCYNVYAASDGRVALAALEPRFWRRFCEVVDRRDLIYRQYHSDAETYREVAGIFAGRSRDEWTELLASHDLPGDPILSADETLDEGQLVARGLGPERGGPVAFPALIDGERPRSTVGFPRLGEHTQAVLREVAPEWSARSRRELLAAGIGPRFTAARLLGRWRASRLAG